MQEHMYIPTIHVEACIADLSKLWQGDASPAEVSLVSLDHQNTATPDLLSIEPSPSQLNITVDRALGECNRDL